MERIICVCIEWLNDQQKRQIQEVASKLGFDARFYVNDQVEGAKSRIAEAEILFAHSPEALQAATDRLKWYCCSFAGVDPYCAHPEWFPTQECLLSCSSGAYDETIGEHLVMTTLMLLRRMPEYARITAERRWENQLPIRSIREVQIGVLGAGNIGSEYARKVLSLGAKPVIGISRTGAPREPFGQVFPTDQLNDVIRRLDVLVMALPGTSDTQGILTRERIALLPVGAMVLNVGRGTAIDQSALIDALESGHLSGAALDVMSPEPLPADHPLWDAKNILITPHVSGNMTMAWTREECVRMFCEDLENYASGKPLNRLVDRALGY
ncbi:D-2-hydroxyacid dehydrogenase [Slackia heliotrinireducens]|uniref:D-2-hydroxyacid dehydrogenase n=1 Tax=Slackia heliotrinireducens TaxID=84110 RepID=UPI00331618B3